MEEINKKKEKKSGLLAALSKFFKGGNPASIGGSSLGSAGSAASGGIFGSSGGLGSFFAGNAGMVGMILGGATIAAVIAVLYNFISPSSNSVYTQDIFRDAYYRDEAREASHERREFSNGSDSASSLDYFREQAKKDGLFGKGSESGDDKKVSSEGTAADTDAAAPAVESQHVKEPQEARNFPKMQPSAGFSNSAGGRKSLVGMGGLSGGIGQPFKQMYRPPAGQGQAGQSSAMKGKLAAIIKQSPKTALSFNKKGAYGQAKYANKMGITAQYSASDAGSRTNAEEAFSGETSGAGDVAAPATGAGLGGAGLVEGEELKESDPSLNDNESSVPEPEETDEDSPWEKWEEYALYAILAAVALIVITRMLSKSYPALATITGYLAMAAAAVVIYAGIIIMQKYEQTWMGLMYSFIGAALVYYAYQALAGIDSGDVQTEAVNQGIEQASEATGVIPE